MWPIGAAANGVATILTSTFESRGPSFGHEVKPLSLWNIVQLPSLLTVMGAVAIVMTAYFVMWRGAGSSPRFAFAAAVVATVILVIDAASDLGIYLA